MASQPDVSPFFPPITTRTGAPVRFSVGKPSTTAVSSNTTTTKNMAGGDVLAAASNFTFAQATVVTDFAVGPSKAIPVPHVARQDPTALNIGSTVGGRTGIGNATVAAQMKNSNGGQGQEETPARGGSFGLLTPGLQTQIGLEDQDELDPSTPQLPPAKLSFDPMTYRGDNGVEVPSTLYQHDGPPPSLSSQTQQIESPSRGQAKTKPGNWGGIFDGDGDENQSEMEMGDEAEVGLSQQVPVARTRQGGQGGEELQSRAPRSSTQQPQSTSPEEHVKAVGMFFGGVLDNDSEVETKPSQGFEGETSPYFNPLPRPLQQTLQPQPQVQVPTSSLPHLKMAEDPNLTTVFEGSDNGESTPGPAGMFGGRRGKMVDSEMEVDDFIEHEPRSPSEELDLQETIASKTSAAAPPLAAVAIQQINKPQQETESNHPAKRGKSGGIPKKAFSALDSTTTIPQTPQLIKARTKKPQAAEIPLAHRLSNPVLPYQPRHDGDGILQAESRRLGSSNSGIAVDGQDRFVRKSKAKDDQPRKSREKAKAPVADGILDSAATPNIRPAARRPKAPGRMTNLPGTPYKAVVAARASEVSSPHQTGPIRSNRQRPGFTSTAATGKQDVRLRDAPVVNRTSVVGKGANGPVYDDASPFVSTATAPVKTRKQARKDPIPQGGLLTPVGMPNEPVHPDIKNLIGLIYKAKEREEKIKVQNREISQQKTELEASASLRSGLEQKNRELVSKCEKTATKAKDNLKKAQEILNDYKVIIEGLREQSKSASNLPLHKKVVAGMQSLRRDIDELFAIDLGNFQAVKDDSVQGWSNCLLLSSHLNELEDLVKKHDEVKEGLKAEVKGLTNDLCIVAERELLYHKKQARRREKLIARAGDALQEAAAVEFQSLTEFKAQKLKLQAGINRLQSALTAEQTRSREVSEELKREQEAVKSLTGKLWTSEQNLEGQQKKFNDLNAELSTLSRTLASEKKKGEDLDKKLSTSDQALQSKTREAADASAELLTTKQSLEDEQRKVIDEKKSIDDLHTELNTVKRNLSEDEKKAADLNTELERTKKNLEDEVKKVAEGKKQGDDLNAELSTVKRNLVDESKKATDLRSAVKTITQDLADERQKVAEEKKKVTEEAKRSSDLAAQLKEVQTNLKANQEELVAKDESFKKEMDDLTKANSKAATEKTEIQKALDSLKQAKNDVESKLEEANTKISNLDKEVRHQQDKVGKANDELKLRESANTDLREEIQKHKATSSRLESEGKEKNLKIQTLTASENDLKEKVSRCEKTNKDTNTQLVAVQKLLDDTKQKLSAANSTLEERSSAISKLTQDSEALSKTVGEAEKKVKEAEKEVTKQSQAQQQSNKKVNELELKLKGFEEELSAARNNNQTLENRLKETRANLKSEQDKGKALAKEHDELKKRVVPRNGRNLFPEKGFPASPVGTTERMIPNSVQTPTRSSQAKASNPGVAARKKRPSRKPSILRHNASEGPDEIEENPSQDQQEDIPQIVEIESQTLAGDTFSQSQSTLSTVPPPAPPPTQQPSAQRKFPAIAGGGRSRSGSLPTQTHFGSIGRFMQTDTLAGHNQLENRKRDVETAGFDQSPDQALSKTPSQAEAELYEKPRIKKIKPESKANVGKSDMLPPPFPHAKPGARW